MLPRRFALIRHVDYTSAAGTGVIAYGVAFDDGQVVLRWSSAHRATSVLDSVEDLIAAHGHGETTSIEWIDAPPGKSDAPAQPGGRRARRTTPDDAPPATETPKPPEVARAEPADVRSGEHPQQEPPQVATEPAAEPSARHAPQAPAETTAPSAPARPADMRPVANAPQEPPSPAETGHMGAPVPAVSAQHATPAQPPATAVEPPSPPNGAPTPYGPSPTPPVPVTPEPDPAPAPAAHAPRSPTSNGATHSSNLTNPANTADPGSTPASPADPTSGPPLTSPRADRSGDRRPHDPAADVVDRPAAGQGIDDDRRARHEAIATQPMNADLSDDRGQRRPRRAVAPPRESPRSIFEEAEEPARPDLRLASSNGRSPEPDESDDAGDTSPDNVDFSGYFPPNHQHLDTVTGLLDLPAGLNRRGRGSVPEQDPTASRRNGRHRGE